MQDLRSVHAALSGKRIFVTGGSGFVGGRLIERLATECRVTIRALVQNWSRASRIARFPVELVRSDVTDAQTVASLVAGCDVIFHCAYGNAGSAARQREVNIEGTRNILNAARAHGVRRLVHLSTILVYGETPDGEIDESAPRRYLGLTYPDSKLDAERLVLEHARAHQLPATILQPAEVYGPYASVWTENVLKALKTSRQILIDGGDGFCSPVYIDDLITAMLLAATKPDAIGETFLIAAARPVTWKEFYGRFENMLGLTATLGMTAAEAERYYYRSLANSRLSSIFREGLRLVRNEPAVRERLLSTREVALLRRVARRVLPAGTRQALRSAMIGKNNATVTNSAPQEQTAQAEKPLEPLDPLSIRLSRSKTVFRIAKAQKVLGYEPQFSFEAGMRLTRRWAEWSNLLGDHSASERSGSNEARI
jgi:nucleoside-diphosphate-sugar epimerase